MVESIALCVDKEPRARNKEWATMQCIEQPCALAESPKEWDITALAALSLALVLRVYKAISTQQDPPDIRFMGAKGRRGQQIEQLGPRAELWALFLALFSALGGHHPHRPAFVQTKQQLNQAMVDLLQKLGSTCK